MLVHLFYDQRSNLTLFDPVIGAVTKSQPNGPNTVEFPVVQTSHDGWVGDWRFMERGHAASFSADRKRLRWIEHTDNPQQIGDLMSAPRNGAATLLARNTSQYAEAPDGRVLAITNHWTEGAQNRLIAIDESAKVATWVADRADDYIAIPGSNDLLVELVNDHGDYDLMRVAMPR
jgi:hypothetical protein